MLVHVTVPNGMPVYYEDSLKNRIYGMYEDCYLMAVRTVFFSLTFKFDQNELEIRLGGNIVQRLDICIFVDGIPNTMSCRNRPPQTEGISFIPSSM
jgi:hypothetical protein